jgi:formylglycine-generating enzyme required for sulfatase activity
MPDHPFDVFISYARADARDFAGRLAESLRGHGITAWLDTAEIEGGAEWLQRLETALAVCRVVIAVRTPGGRQSSWVRRERLYALNWGKPIIPVLRLDTEDDLELIDRQPVDFRHSFEQALPQLLKEIQRLSNGHPPGTKDRRTLELAYLGRILLEHSIWRDLYTPMAGVAQLRKARPRADKPQMVTAPNPIGQVFREKVREQFHHDDLVATEQREYDDILPAVEDMRQLVVLGDPGSGKTTTLWRVAVEYAEQARDDPAKPLPVFVRLGEIKPDQTLDGYIIGLLGELGTYYHTLLEEKRLVLLLDGLNELPTQNRAELAGQVRELVQRCQQAGMTAAVTCRELDYVETLNVNVPQQARIAPLDVFRIRQFVNGYIKEPPGAGDTLFWQLAGGSAVQEAWAKWQEAGATFDLFWTAEEVPRDEPNVYERTNDALDRAWREAVHGDRSMITLARNPYMLYMMTQVFTEEGEIPQNRGALFRLFVDFLLLERERLAEADADNLKTRLTNLAYVMQAEGEAGTSVDRDDALGYLIDEGSLYQAQSANILSGTDEIRFTHQLLQEFFAAHKMDVEMLAGTPASDFWPPETWWEPTGWEETAILLAGLYSDDCTPVLDWLGDANPELAARCALESGAHVPEETLARWGERWQPRLTDLKRDPQPQARAAIGRGVGRLKLDHRPGVGLRPDGVPDIDWVKIPAGKFIIGSDKARDPQAEGNEMPQQSFYLDTFHISRYPVTYAQYAVFVNDDGYANPAYWTESGWAWKEERREPALWHNPQWHIANHPVVGVTWYEAYAFTQWLSAKLGTAVTLPSEAQWERAARGTDGRIYPYGNTFDAGKGNTDETGIGRTSAVGIFPQGASPDGVLDMSGNVWEWCLTKWGWKYADGIEAMDNDPAGTETRVLRGGAFNFDPYRARCAYRRYHSPPHIGYANYGFRVVCARPPSR